MVERFDETSKRDTSRMGIVLMLVGQVFAVGWWASNINAKLDAAASKISDLQAAQYTRTEAAANFRNVELQIMDTTRRVADLEGRKGSR